MLDPVLEVSCLGIESLYVSLEHLGLLLSLNGTGHVSSLMANGGSWTAMNDDTGDELYPYL